MQFPKSSLLLLPYLSASISALPTTGSGNTILSVGQENKFPPEGVVCQTAQENNIYSNAAIQTALAKLVVAIDHVAYAPRGDTLDPAYHGGFNPETQVNPNDTVVWYSYSSSLVTYALTGQDLMIANRDSTGVSYSAILTNSDAVAAGTGLAGKGLSVGYHQCNDVVPAPAR